MQYNQPALFLYADNPDTASRVKSWIDRYFSLHPPTRIIYDANQIELILSEHLQPLLIFISRHLDDSHKILLKRLSSKEQRIQVMLCATPDLSLEAWGMEAGYFLSMPLKEVQFARPIQRYLRLFSDERTFNGLNIKHENSMIPVRYNDVLYIKADGNYSDIHLAGGQRITVTMQLGKMTERCANSLLLQKVDRSLIVNISRIKSFNENRLTFISDKNISIELSKGKALEIRKLLFNHYQ
jgi:two-component system, LytTR family, response regulator